MPSLISMEKSSMLGMNVKLVNQRGIWVFSNVIFGIFLGPESVAWVDSQMAGAMMIAMKIEIRNMNSRIRIGIKFQTIIGTGKPPWQKINNEDLDKTISRLNMADPQKVYLSGHDTCDQSIQRIKQNLVSDIHILKSGETYRF